MALCTLAQTPAPQRLHVEPPSQLTVKSGRSTSASIDVTVQSGFHVNSDKPRNQFLIPLRLTWTGTTLHPETVAYPKSEEIEVGGERTSVFTGKFAIRTQFKVESGVPKGPALMTGKLFYQACNNQMCFRPASTEFRLPVVIE